MVHETITSLPPTEVLQRAVEFFGERVPHMAAYPERQSDDYLLLRGQGGEEVALVVLPESGSTRVRASTLFFDQAIGRFFSTLPGKAAAA